MTVRIAPTLAAMADVYELSTDGGPESPRFSRYIELNRDGFPVAGFNPMTSSDDTVGTITALVELDAEELASETANEFARDLGLRQDIGLSITVATPGMWTDRIATEIEHRIGGRRWSEIVLWSGESVDADQLRRLTRSQLVRAGWAMVHQTPRTVAQVAGQEGLAGALAFGRDAVAEAVAAAGASTDPAVAEILDKVGDETALALRASFLYGDEIAQKLGWTPLGLGEGAGYGHSIAVAAETLANFTPSKLLHTGWTPVTTEPLTSPPDEATLEAVAHALPAGAAALEKERAEAKARAQEVIEVTEVVPDEETQGAE
jgi:hypothetical protein